MTRCPARLTGVAHYWVFDLSAGVAVAHSVKALETYQNLADETPRERCVRVFRGIFSVEAARIPGVGAQVAQWGDRFIGERVTHPPPPVKKPPPHKKKKKK